MTQKPTTFSYEDALRKSTEYFNGDAMAARVFLDKYSLRDTANNIIEETPEKLHRRLAKEFAAAAQKRLKKAKLEKIENLSGMGKVFFNKVCKMTEVELSDYFFSLFHKFQRIVPQGRVMSGLGAEESYRSLSNCLRLPPPKDSYSSIMYSDTMLISAAKRGCGYGLGISNLRPSGTFVKNSAQSSTGAVSFMPRFSTSTREVAQHGRRGACLIDIDVRHPDTEQFITSKKDKQKVTGANISVKYVDEFFYALEQGEDFLARFPIDADVSKIDLAALEYDVLVDINGAWVKKINPKSLFGLTVKSARDDAEPGIFFWDRMKNYDPADVYKDYEIDGTNACGEQPMAVGDTCRLIVENLFSFVKNPFTKNAQVDLADVYENSFIQLFLGDILVDLEIKYIDRILEKIKNDPEPEEEKAIEIQLWTLVRKIAEKGRRVGCGITALGDMIAAVGLKYGSKESIDLVESVMKIKMKGEIDASVDLAVLFTPFTGWDDTIEFPDNLGGNAFYKFIQRELPDEVGRMRKFGRRNINWSTVAPCGTVSIMTQSTSGCEPLFSPYYTRRVKINPNDKNHKIDFTDKSGDSWREEIVIHPKLKYFMDIRGLEANKENTENAFKLSPYLFATADAIDWRSRIEMQGVLQDYTTSAISTTLNLPKDVSEQTVYDIYIASWKRGLKGQTIYREGSRDGVLIEKKEKESNCAFTKRPRELQCDVYHCKVKGEEYFCIIGLDACGNPYELFAGKNGVISKNIEKGTIYKQKRGHYQLYSNNELVLDNITGFLSDDGEAITRMTSMSLRNTLPSNLPYIVEQLAKVQGDFTNLSRAFARCLKKYIPDGTSIGRCEEVKDGEVCGGEIVRENGCQICRKCLTSLCG